MRKFIKNTLTTITAFLVVVTASSAASEGFNFVPEDTTGIVVDTEVSFDEEENDEPEVQPCSDEPSRDRKEDLLS